MKKTGSFFTVMFALVMFICVLFVIWYIPSVHELRFRLADTGSRLESMQGQVRKQQYELDQTVAALPETQAELDKIIPLNEAAEEEVKSLKAERKKLRGEKKELTEQLESAVQKEDADHE